MLSRVGVTNVEKVTRIGAQLYYARLDCFVELGPDRKRASRFDEVINDVIGEVVLGAGALQGRAARPAHRRRGARAAGRAARGGDDRRPLSRVQAGAGVRDRHAGDLHAARLGGRLRARHAPARGRRRAGDDGVPGRAAAGRRALARAPGRRRLQRRPDRRHPRGRAGRDARPARPRHAPARAARGVRHGRGRGGAARDRRGLDVQRDLRADEALRRGRGGREGHAPSAVRGGLRRRGDPRRARALRRPGRRRLRVGAPGEPRDDPPAQRRRRALRAARRAAPRRRVARHTTMREWLSAA